MQMKVGMYERLVHRMQIIVAHRMNVYRSVG